MRWSVRPCLDSNAGPAVGTATSWKGGSELAGLAAGGLAESPGRESPTAPVTSRCLVLVPARSERGRLSRVVDGVLDTLDADVLVLDAGANDFSASGFSERVVSIRVPQGVGSAVRKGLEYAVSHGYDVVTRIDGDGQHSPTILRDILARHRADADMVVGSRYHPLSPVISAPPTDRIALNVMFRSVVKQLCGLAMTDVISGCWAMNRSTMEFVAPRIQVKEYGSTLEILLLLGLARRFSVHEVPHPAIYAGHGIEARYTEAQLTHRCDRAGVYLKVVADVMNRHGVDAWPLLIQR
ncbi:glycosyltransferase family 2 protein [Streptomyces sp. NPDC059552]|uniref:glycosyltransferase family 2 protein n=1 Tax=Streptomyces sp. NPDC059552 TaxID=3346862 RepID=UPI00367DCE17